MKGRHIAKIDYPEVFSPCFGSFEESKAFYDEIKESNTDAKVALHQSARMVWFADRIEQIKSNRPALQILFYLIAAEAVAKIYDNYSEEGKSPEYVKKFFSEFCSDNDKGMLSKTIFFDCNKTLSLEEVVGILYYIRCDVVHRGKYFEIAFPTANEPAETLSPYKGQTIHITLKINELKLIILRTEKEACLRILKNQKGCMLTNHPDSSRRWRDSRDQ